MADESRRTFVKIASAATVGHAIGFAQSPIGGASKSIDTAVLSIGL
jgi:hypothetical protein